MRYLVPVVMLTGLLGACGSYSPPGTPEFKLAYVNGCQNGYEQGGRANHTAQARDNQLYAGNTEYRKGWDEGFNECFDAAISRPYGEGGAGGGGNAPH